MREHGGAACGTVSWHHRWRTVSDHTVIGLVDVVPLCHVAEEMPLRRMKRPLIPENAIKFANQIVFTLGKHDGLGRVHDDIPDLINFIQ